MSRRSSSSGSSLRNHRNSFHGSEGTLSSRKNSSRGGIGSEVNSAYSSGEYLPPISPSNRGASPTRAAGAIQLLSGSGGGGHHGATGQTTSSTGGGRSPGNSFGSTQVIPSGKGTGGASNQGLANLRKRSVSILSQHDIDEQELSAQSPLGSYRGGDVIGSGAGGASSSPFFEDAGHHTPPVHRLESSTEEELPQPTTTTNVVIPTPGLPHPAPPTVGGGSVYPPAGVSSRRSTDRGSGGLNNHQHHHPQFQFQNTNNDYNNTGGANAGLSPFAASSEGSHPSMTHNNNNHPSPSDSGSNAMLRVKNSGGGSRRKRKGPEAGNLELRIDIDDDEGVDEEDKKHGTGTTKTSGGNDKGNESQKPQQQQRVLEDVPSSELFPEKSFYKQVWGCFVGAANTETIPSLKGTCPGCNQALNYTRFDFSLRDPWLKLRLSTKASELPLLWFLVIVFLYTIVQLGIFGVDSVGILIGQVVFVSIALVCQLGIMRYREKKAQCDHIATKFSLFQELYHSVVLGVATLLAASSSHDLDPLVCKCSTHGLFTFAQLAPVLGIELHHVTTAVVQVLLLLYLVLFETVIHHTSHEEGGAEGEGEIEETLIPTLIFHVTVAIAVIFMRRSQFLLFEFNIKKMLDLNTDRKSLLELDRKIDTRLEAATSSTLLSCWLLRSPEAPAVCQYPSAFALVIQPQFIERRLCGWKAEENQLAHIMGKIGKLIDSYAAKHELKKSPTFHTFGASDTVWVVLGSSVPSTNYEVQSREAVKMVVFANDIHKELRKSYAKDSEGEGPSGGGGESSSGYDGPSSSTGARGAGSSRAAFVDLDVSIPFVLAMHRGPVSLGYIGSKPTNVNCFGSVANTCHNILDAAPSAMFIISDPVKSLIFSNGTLSSKAFGYLPKTVGNNLELGMHQVIDYKQNTSILKGGGGGGNSSLFVEGGGGDLETEDGSIASSTRRRKSKSSKKSRRGGGGKRATIQDPRSSVGSSSGTTPGLFIGGGGGPSLSDAASLQDGGASSSFGDLSGADPFGATSGGGGGGISYTNPLSGPQQYTRPSDLLRQFKQTIVNDVSGEGGLTPKRRGGGGTTPKGLPSPDHKRLPPTSYGGEATKVNIGGNEMHLHEDECEDDDREDERDEDGRIELPDALGDYDFATIRKLWIREISPKTLLPLWELFRFKRRTEAAYVAFVNEGLSGSADRLNAMFNARQVARTCAFVVLLLVAVLYLYMTLFLLKTSEFVGHVVTIASLSVAALILLVVPVCTTCTAFTAAGGSLYGKYGLIKTVLTYVILGTTILVTGSVETTVFLNDSSSLRILTGLIGAQVGMGLMPTYYVLMLLDFLFLLIPSLIKMMIWRGDQNGALTSANALDFVLTILASLYVMFFIGTQDRKMRHTFINKEVSSSMQARKSVTNRAFTVMVQGILPERLNKFFTQGCEKCLEGRVQLCSCISSLDDTNFLCLSFEYRSGGSDRAVLQMGNALMHIVDMLLASTDRLSKEYTVGDVIMVAEVRTLTSQYGRKGVNNKSKRICLAFWSTLCQILIKFDDLAPSIIGPMQRLQDQQDGLVSTPNNRGGGGGGAGSSFSASFTTTTPKGRRLLRTASMNEVSGGQVLNTSGRGEPLPDALSGASGDSLAVEANNLRQRSLPTTTATSGEGLPTTSPPVGLPPTAPPTPQSASTALPNPDTNSGGSGGGGSIGGGGGGFGFKLFAGFSRGPAHYSFSTNRYLLTGKGPMTAHGYATRQLVGENPALYDQSTFIASDDQIQYATGHSVGLNFSSTSKSNGSSSTHGADKASSSSSLSSKPFPVVGMMIAHNPFAAMVAAANQKSSLEEDGDDENGDERSTGLENGKSNSNQTTTASPPAIPAGDGTGLNATGEASRFLLRGTSEAVRWRISPIGNIRSSRGGGAGSSFIAGGSDSTTTAMDLNASGSFVAGVQYNDHARSLADASTTHAPEPTFHVISIGIEKCDDDSGLADIVSPLLTILAAAMRGNNSSSTNAAGGGVPSGAGRSLTGSAQWGGHTSKSPSPVASANTSVSIHPADRSVSSANNAHLPTALPSPHHQGESTVVG